MQKNEALKNEHFIINEQNEKERNEELVEESENEMQKIEALKSEQFIINEQNEKERNEELRTETKKFENFNPGRL